MAVSPKLFISAPSNHGGYSFRALLNSGRGFFAVQVCEYKGD